jgi:hypothetical protein
MDSQNDFRKDKSSPDRREYNQGPRNREVTEQNDVRRRADVRVCLCVFAPVAPTRSIGGFYGHVR